MDKNFKVPDSKSQWPLLGYKRTLLAGIAILSRQSQQRVLRLYGTGKSAEKRYNTRTVLNRALQVYHNYTASILLKKHCKMQIRKSIHNQVNQNNGFHNFCLNEYFFSTFQLTSNEIDAGKVMKKYLTKSYTRQ